MASTAETDDDIIDDEHFHDSTLIFPPEVQEAIDQVTILYFGLNNQRF